MQIKNSSRIRQKYDWKLTIKMNIFFLKITGLWPAGSEGYKANFYSLYAIIVVNIFIGGFNMFQIINIFFLYQDLEALAQLMLPCLAEALSLAKLYIFMKNIRMLKQLMITLNGDIFQPKNRRQRLLIEDSLNSWRRVYNVFTIAVGPAVSLWVTLPIWTKSYKYYRLPFSAWYPFNTEKSPNYQITYFYEVISIFLAAFSGYNVDMLISALMMYVGAQCDILSDNLKGLGGTYHNFDKKLIRCILHHKQIISFAENCNHFCNFIVLGQFLVSSICIAMGLFWLSLVSPLSTEFYMLTTSVICIVVQIFTYCWFGNKVEIKSDKIAYAAFQSDWIHQPLNVKKNLIFFIMRTRKPIKMSAFNLFYLSLETFMKILRSAVSYFTMLRQINYSK